MIFDKIRKIILEATLVGIMVIIYGYGCLWLVTKFGNQTAYNMPLALFLTGFLLHITAQVTGINAYYCTHGVACENHKIDQHIKNLATNYHKK